MSEQGGVDHRSRYAGKDLAYLLVAICLPAALLYLRLVLGLAASDTRVTPHQAAHLSKLSNIAWYLFFLVQVLCAAFLQHRYVKSARLWLRAAQFVGILIICLLFSFTGTVMLEAIGFSVFLRIAAAR